MLTSKKPTSDTTVVLSPDDHDFIKHPTVVSFADAKIHSTENILKRAEERDIEPRCKFRSDTVEAIQQGLMDSPFTPRDIKKIFADSVERRSSGQAVDTNNPAREL